MTFRDIGQTRLFVTRFRIIIVTKPKILFVTKVLGVGDGKPSESSPKRGQKALKKVNF
jgi:hypothetical protein